MVPENWWKCLKEPRAKLIWKRASPIIKLINKQNWSHSFPFKIVKQFYTQAKPQSFRDTGIIQLPKSLKLYWHTINSLRQNRWDSMLITRKYKIINWKEQWTISIQCPFRQLVLTDNRLKLCNYCLDILPFSYLLSILLIHSLCQSLFVRIVDACYVSR